MVMKYCNITVAHVCYLTVFALRGLVVIQRQQNTIRINMLFLNMMDGT